MPYYIIIAYNRVHVQYEILLRRKNQGL